MEIGQYIEEIRRKFSSVYSYLIYGLFCKRFGANIRIYRPLKISGVRYIELGCNISIEEGAWITASPLTNSLDSIIKIGNGTRIGHYSHIYGTKEIEIGQNVLIADRVYISDNSHAFSNPFIAILDQEILQLNAVTVGDGAWIGENACLIGVKVGRNCVIGANSVVTRDIPDYSVAVGIPAKVIKRYDFIRKAWVGVDD